MSLLYLLCVQGPHYSISPLRRRPLLPFRWENAPRQATVYLCFQYMLALYILQHSHLLDSDLVEFMKTLALRHSFIDKNRIQVFHIAQTNQLIDGRIIAKVAISSAYSFIFKHCAREIRASRVSSLYSV